MISMQAFLSDVAPSVHSTIQNSGLPPDYIAAPTLSGKRMAAHRFAEFVTRKRFGRAAVICECSLPQSGYVSWLLVGPLGIAFDSEQVRAWSTIVGENAPAEEVQIARAIMHELGHIFGTPGLLSRQHKRIIKKGQTFTAPATKEEEDTAWVWAMSAFAIALGHHAWRRRPLGLDDTTVLAI